MRMGRWMAASVLVLLCAMGCATPEKLAQEHKAKVTAKLDGLKKICARWDEDKKHAPKKGKLPDKLVVMTPSEGRLGEHNAVLMDGDMCPELKILLDDKPKTIGQSSLTPGYAIPVAFMADVYWRKNKYTMERYGKDTSEMKADIRAVERLEYAILWSVEELNFPLIDGEKQTFQGGSFKGKFITYRLKDGKPLSSVLVEAENKKDVEINHGERTITRTNKEWDVHRRQDVYRSQSKTVNLGTFEKAAQRGLMMDLSWATEDAAQKAVPYTEP